MLGLAEPARAAAVAGTPDATASFDGAVRAIAYAGSTVYVGGDFTKAYSGGRTYPRSRLAAIDARTGALLAWAPAADGRIRGLVATGSSVFAIGDFGYVNGVRRDSLVRLRSSDGAVLSGFAHAINGVPHTIGAGNGRLYVGGSLTAVDGYPRSGLAAFDLSSGALDGAWRPTADATVQSLAVAPDRVYLSGDFQQINGVSGSARLGAVDPANGGYDGSFRPEVRYVARGVAVSADGVYAAHGGPGGRLVSYDFAGAARWTITTDGDGQAVAVLGDVVYLGGHFDNVCRSARTGNQGSCVDGSERRVKIAAISPAGQLLDWAPQANGVEGVFAIATTVDLWKVAIGGTFTTVGGASRLRFAQFSS